MGRRRFQADAFSLVMTKYGVFQCISFSLWPYVVLRIYFTVHCLNIDDDCDKLHVYWFWCWYGFQESSILIAYIRSNPAMCLPTV